MAQGARVGAAAGSSSASSSASIPANARKVVQDLQEIVKIGEDEIYAMLKECNMDPNETVQRLLSQDTFHEVKRKRDRKKENSSKEPIETRAHAAGAGSSMRGGRPRPRGNYSPRYNPEFSSGGRGQAYGRRDTGTQQNGKNLYLAPNVPSDLQGFTKPAAHMSNENGPMAPASASGLAAVPNGSSQYSRVVHATRSNSGSSLATMADIVKSSATNQANVVSAPLKAGSQQLLYPSDGSLPSSDHMLHPYVDSLGVEQNSEFVGLERSVRDTSPSFSSLEMGSAPESFKQGSQTRQLGAFGLDAFSSISDSNEIDPSIAGTSAPSHPRELIPPLKVTVEGPTSQTDTGSPELSGRPSFVGSLHNGRVAYQAQSQTVGSEKGSGLEWRPKSPAQRDPPMKSINSVNEAQRDPAMKPFTSVNESQRDPLMKPFNSVNEAQTRAASSQENVEFFLNSASRIQQLSINEDQPVIIPDHLQVSEADRTHLNFGSFGEDFETNSNFVDDDVDDDNKSTVSEESLHEEETTIEQSSVPSLVNTSTISTAAGYVQQPTPSPIQTSIIREDVKLSMPTPVSLPMSQPEVSKPDSLVQQDVHHPMLSTGHSYAGSGTVPQLPSGQFTYEQPETQHQEAPRVSSFVSHSDPSANAAFYNPVFRPNPDLDSRYAQFVSASANKYSAGTPQMSGQSLSSSQEGGNSIAIPSNGPTGQASATLGLSQSALTIPQQHIPIQAYPSQHAGVPLTPFGANVFGIHFLPQSYGYTPPPYHHSYSGHGHTPLPQAPDIFFAPGSSYGAAAYPSTGAVPMKYAFSHYKPGGAAGNAPHSAVPTGYGNFSTSPSGFTTINSAVTSAASASGYEDANGPPYKDTTLYMPNQQPAQGSGVWIQNPPSRDIAEMQTNSYYNLLGQGQHSSFGHTQAMHAVPAAAYASLYNQSQSGSAPNIHQLLQQPQALSAVGGVGTQSGPYQQQRQLNWPPNY